MRRGDALAKAKAKAKAKVAVAKQLEWVRSLIGQAEADVTKLTPTVGSVRFELDSEILTLD
ncbi:hypothetical protein, partial [Burkholderia sp. Ac-20345]|uniref:hypothetical protein n=1 Tax=Burkholderia sp. Ac-20345 TaxID=2703891 RepID=UPI00197B6A97